MKLRLPITLSQRLVASALLPVLLLVGACASNTELIPAEGARDVPGMPNAAISEVAGVDVVVASEEWPGEVDIEGQVTPLHVTIENEGDHEVRVRYADFALISLDGRRHSALPPYSVTGSVEEPGTAEQRPAAGPSFDHSRFSVARPYEPLYPGVPAFGGPFFYDPAYYDRYSTYWQGIPLPTYGMLERLLPEGVIEPGGMVSGYLFFEKVTESDRRVRFRADLVNASTGEELGEISIPFDVYQPGQ